MKHHIGGLTDKCNSFGITYPDLIEEWDEENVKWKKTSLTLNVTRHSFGYLAVPKSVICDFRSTTEELDSTPTPVTGEFVKKTM